MGIAYDEKLPAMERNARFLCQWVEELTGIRLQLAPGSKKAAIRLTLDLPTDKGRERGGLREQEQEAYTITVGKKGINISARQPVGVFRAVQTLLKSLPIGASADGVRLPFAVVTL